MSTQDGILLPEGMTSGQYNLLSAEEKSNLIWCQVYKDGELKTYNGQQAIEIIQT